MPARWLSWGRALQIPGLGQHGESPPRHTRTGQRPVIDGRPGAHNASCHDRDA